MPHLATSRAILCLSLFAMLALSGCTPTDKPSDLGNVQGWRFASGKAPTRAEYAAVVAACQDRAVPRLQDQPLAACLADLGLRRSR
jgi:hypothetical protein